jgi:hypothetical protein
MAEAAEACRAAAGELHDQGLISAALLERISASLRRPSEGVPPAAESAAPEADGGTALALLRESVVSFPIFVRAHLLQDSWAEGPAGGAVMLARLDACSSSYLRGDLEEYKAAVDSLGAELLRSNPSIADGSAGWFQNELTALMEGLVQYYLGSNHWDRPDDVLKANTDDAEVEVSVAAEAASAAMSRSWSRLKRSVWDNAVTNRLSTVREFSTMTDILKSVATDETEDADLAAARRTLRESRPPFIVLLGGGMAAGKSTVVHKLKHEWTGSVVIEADQFKMNGACVLPSLPPPPLLSAWFCAQNRRELIVLGVCSPGRVDIFFRELNKLTGGDNEVAAMVHSNSTSAANKQLIAALSSGRDVVLDGTMTWQPFVEQTIEMIRQVHQYQYSLGPGWVPETKTEEYYVRGARLADPRPPYRIKMVGVTCDPAIAVGRGFRRKVITGRGVPLPPQIRSHRLYSQHFLDYVPLVDEASLYDTSSETLEVARVSVDNGRRTS